VQTRVALMLNHEVTSRASKLVLARTSSNQKLPRAPENIELNGFPRSLEMPRLINNYDGGGHGGYS